MVVYNHAVLPVVAVAIGLGVVVDKETALPDHGVLLVAIGAATLVAAIMEWRLRPAWRPRLFWVFPVWVIGLGVVGGVMVAHVNPWAGAGVIAVAGLGFALDVVRHSRGPGGRWVLWMTASGVGLIAESLVEHELVVDAKPWWGYAIRGGLLAAFLYATYRLIRARAHAREQVP